MTPQLLLLTVTQSRRLMWYHRLFYFLNLWKFWRWFWQILQNCHHYHPAAFCQYQVPKVAPVVQENEPPPPMHSLRKGQVSLLAYLFFMRYAQQSGGRSPGTSPWSISVLASSFPVSHWGGSLTETSCYWPQCVRVGRSKVRC